MAARKTVSLKSLIKNHRTMTDATLTNPNLAGEAGKQVRIALNIALETVLHDAGDYRGFKYVNDYTVDDTARHYYGEY